MAITTVKQFPFAALSPFNALLPEFARCEDKTLRWNGHPVEVHCIVNNSTTAAYNLQTTLKRVLTGIVYNVTDDTNATTITVLPKATDKTIAVLGDDLTAAKTYLVLVIGTLD